MPPKSLGFCFSYIRTICDLALLTAILTLSISKTTRFNANWFTAIPTRLISDARAINRIVFLKMAVGTKQFEAFRVCFDRLQRRIAPAAISQFVGWVFVMKLQSAGTTVIPASLASIAPFGQQDSSLSCI